MADKVEMKVKNAREIRVAFRRLELDVQKELQRELRQVARPVADTASQIASELGLAESTVTGYKPRTSVGIAKVQQTKRRTTGLRPQYGRMQMVKVLIPALHEHAERIRVEIGLAIDRATGRFNRG